MNPSRVLARWLGDYLGDYFENVDTQALQTGLWRGNLVLQDLKVRADVSRKLRLPIVLEQGCVEFLRLEVPWKSFSSQRASLHISGVTLVLEPLGSVNYN
ncbi:unnamed protein product, partial [Ascophyllum nodosum]